MKPVYVSIEHLPRSCLSFERGTKTACQSAGCESIVNLFLLMKDMFGAPLSICFFSCTISPLTGSTIRTSATPVNVGTSFLNSKLKWLFISTYCSGSVASWNDVAFSGSGTGVASFFKSFHLAPVAKPLPVFESTFFCS